MNIRYRIYLGLLLAVCVPFVLVGLTAFGYSFQFWIDGQLRTGVGLSAIAVMLLGLGAVLPVHAVRVARKSADFENRTALYPDRPWFWRQSWEEGRITVDSDFPWVLTITTLCWNLVVVGVGLLTWGDWSAEAGSALWLIAVFPLAGAALLVLTIIAAVRWKLFGASTFVMDRVPFRSGSFLSGVIRTRIDASYTGRFRLRLSCIRKIVVWEGNTRQAHERLLWQDEKHVASVPSADNRGRLSIPVCMDIPEDVAATSLTTPGDRILWRLTACARVRGLRYSATFEVPVFEGSETSASDSAGEGKRPPLREEADDAIERLTGLRDSGVTVQRPDWDTTDFHFPRASNRSAAGWVGLLTAGWLVATWLLITQDAPFYLAILFSACSACLLYGCGILWLYESYVRLTPDGLEITRGPLGWSRTRQIRADEVRDIEARPGLRVFRNVYYNVFLMLENGREVMLASELENARASLLVAGYMRSHIRRLNRPPTLQVTEDRPPVASGTGEKARRLTPG